MNSAPSLPNDPRAVVRFARAAEVTGMSRDTLRRMVKAGTGPRTLKLSERCLGIRVGDLLDWMQSREMMK